MDNMIGRGMQYSPSNSFSSNGSNNSFNAFTVEVKFSYPVDFYWEAAAWYLEMFGVTRDDEVLKSWTLFTNQYQENSVEDYVLETANFFRNQP